MSFIQLAFGFNGRIRRRDFWLGLILLAFASGFTVMILFPVAAIVLGIPRWGMPAPSYLLWFIQLAIFWPVLAIAVKRGHDRNRPAVWIIAVYVVDTAASALILPHSVLWPSFRIAELAFAAYVVVDLGLLDSSKGAIRFGPSLNPPSPIVEAVV